MGESARQVPKLTLGEIDCVHHLIDGRSDQEIAVVLNVSPATVHWRIERAKKKFNIRTRAQLTALAVHYGLVAVRGGDSA